MVSPNTLGNRDCLPLITSHSTLFRQSLVCDVTPVKHALEMDLGDRLVGVAFGVGQRIAQRGDAEHPAAVGDDETVFQLCSGMKYFHAGQLGGVGEASDDAAFRVAAGVT